VIARVVFLVAAALSLAVGQPRYIGAQACGACHPRQFAAQAATGHAQALTPATKHALAEFFTSATSLHRPPGYRFQFRRQGKELRVYASGNAETADIPVEWAFGAGLQAVTFVTRLSPDWYLEHYFSYYSGAKVMAAAPGHRELAPESLREAMGLPYKAADPAIGMIGCFECHSTGPVRQSPTGLQPSEPGVRCESCHGPGSAHRDKPQTAIRNPKHMPAVQLNRFCGTCHRSPSGPTVSINWSEPWNVRHQPPYLEQSACFRGSNGALSCLTCHALHEPLRRDAASYTAKCAGCHSDQHRPPSAACTGDCTLCHMPSVSPQAYLRFTNHWIGIYGDGAKLRPRP
jgi:cytochrome c554/c'-like protein